MLYLIVAVLLGGLFLLAGLSKAMYLEEFRKALYAFRVLPIPLVPAFSLALVTAEIATGMTLLVCPRLTPYGAVSAILLLTMFTTVLCINLLAGRRELKCGCFGRQSRGISWGLAAKNVAFIGSALFLATRQIVLPSVLVSICVAASVGSRFYLDGEITASMKSQ